MHSPLPPPRSRFLFRMARGGSGWRGSPFGPQTARGRKQPLVLIVVPGSAVVGESSSCLLGMRPQAVLKMGSLFALDRAFSRTSQGLASASTEHQSAGRVARTWRELPWLSTLAPRRGGAGVFATRDAAFPLQTGQHACEKVDPFRSSVLKLRWQKKACSFSREVLYFDGTLNE